jgi:hypothetical protein
MAKRSARKRYARASSLRGRRRQSGSRWFRVTTAAVVILGALVVVQSRDARSKVGALPGAAPNKDHWHAALGINICGDWQPNVPTFEGNGGVHSHGDGLMHIHPFDEAHAHGNANINTFFKGVGYTVSSTSIKIAGKTYKTGDKCPKLKEDGKIRWVVNGKERTGSGDPGKYAPKNLEYITIAFVPADYDFNKIKEPNNKSALNNIQDLSTPTTTEGAPTSSTAPGSPPGSTDTSAPPATTATTAPTATTKQP